MLEDTNLLDGAHIIVAHKVCLRVLTLSHLCAHVVNPLSISNIFNGKKKLYKNVTLQILNFVFVC